MPEKGKSVWGYVRSLMILLLLCGMVTLAIFAFLHQRKRICEDVSVTIEYGGTHKPVTEKEVVAIIEHSGLKVIGVEERNVNLAAIYDTLGNLPFVKAVNPIYFSGSTLNIDLQLHEFVAHVYPNNGNDYFICADGTLLTYSPRIKERLLIACGNIPALKTNSCDISQAGKTLNRIYDIAQLIAADKFYSAQFKQLYVNAEKEFELIASVGKHTILIGDGSNAEEQLSQLRTVYKQGIAFMQPDKYSHLDLRYKNRIIAQKR